MGKTHGEKNERIPPIKATRKIIIYIISEGFSHSYIAEIP
jgi:hypothetical protein